MPQTLFFYSTLYLPIQLISLSLSMRIIFFCRKTPGYGKLQEIEISPFFHVEISPLFFSSFTTWYRCYRIETSSLSCIRIETSHSFIMGAMERIKVRFVWSSNPRLYWHTLYFPPHMT